MTTIRCNFINISSDIFTKQNICVCTVYLMYKFCFFFLIETERSSEFHSTDRHFWSFLPQVDTAQLIDATKSTW